MEHEYQQASVELNGKTQHPAPLVFYAAVLRDAPQPKLAGRFLAWLQGPEARQILARYHYDGPGDDKPLVP
jgi:molybdate/tungstate transport system substrate-binding protein